MKKRAIKNLAFRKSIISKFDHVEKIKGGNRSETSCLCGPSQCDCIAEDTM
ncbi:hypothetical protein IMCC3317_15780 [Kordia antarctica]|uniref:Uncharacterized protein n=1 Tax=Kordia antarctica TaxID=1218801 RepID=A0A7L4ZIH3_9FLAO|nr:hypothetical protein [Kordia antarctica]QHI36219.1 hypothetical protein IMCC3317_15780 [Kordia antarctica]